MTGYEGSGECWFIQQPFDVTPMDQARVFPPTRVGNNTFLLPSNEQLLERQLSSYANLFRTIADQISELNDRIDTLSEAAE